eukprot:69527_1
MSSQQNMVWQKKTDQRQHRRGNRGYRGRGSRARGRGRGSYYSHNINHRGRDRGGGRGSYYTHNTNHRGRDRGRGRGSYYSHNINHRSRGYIRRSYGNYGFRGYRSHRGNRTSNNHYSQNISKQRAVNQIQATLNPNNLNINSFKELVNKNNDHKILKNTLQNVFETMYCIYTDNKYKDEQHEMIINIFDHIMEALKLNNYILSWYKPEFNRFIFRMIKNKNCNKIFRHIH